MTTVPPPVAASGDAVRDQYGFVVKKELEQLYLHFAPVLADEEAERAERWEHFMRELQQLVPSSEGEDEAQLLHRALSHLDASTNTGEPPPQTAELLQRLSSLVQAGLPMSKRGAFWRMFLNVGAKRQEGEYQRLVVEVKAIEVACRFSAGDSNATSDAAKVAAAGTKGPQHSISLVADASSLINEKEAQYRKYRELHQHHQVDVFSIVQLDGDESPRGTPVKTAAGTDGGGGGDQLDSQASPAANAAAAAASAAEAAADFETSPPQAPVVALAAIGLQVSAAPPAATPASTLQTPQACSTSSSSSGGSGSVMDTTARWTHQEYLSQIDKDLHRTFPGHPCMDLGGRAALRRILSAYARRNTAVGYCQGLNFLGATFLLLMLEEDAFWCLAALVEDVLGSSYFDERMAAPQVDVLVYGHLLQGRFPTLWRHLAALEVDAASVTLHWFLLGFLNSLPLDSTLRVWDLLFFERSPVVLFRVALALVEIYEQALMCTRESSDAYMLLQCCAQMTFDSSRLVDTATIGYAHLRPAGLAALRNRYRPAVMDNLRGSFASEDDFSRYMDSQQASPSSSVGADNGRTSAAPVSFAEMFRRVSTAMTEAEEVALRAAAAIANTAADGGHLSSTKGRRQSSPGATGSQPASPLARMRQAVSGLTSRLMPSALPPLLPAGAVDGRGLEQQPLCSVVAAAVARRTSCPSAEASDAGTGSKGSTATGTSTAKLHVRTTSAGGAAYPNPSPTAHLSHSASKGAELGRRPPGGLLTPFSDLEALLAAAPPLQDAPGSWTPPQRRPMAADSPGGSDTAPRLGLSAAAFQSMPATPSDLLMQLPPPASTQRRALTAGDPGTRTSSHRRRRRLTIDLLNLADLRPDLAQPGVAAAWAIAANPSPRAGADRAGGSSAARHRPSIPAGSVLGAHAAGANQPLKLVEVPLAGSLGASSLQDELPIRALHFDDVQEGCNGRDGGDDLASSNSLIRRTSTAPPSALLASAQPSTAAGSAHAECVCDDGELHSSGAGTSGLASVARLGTPAYQYGSGSLACTGNSAAQRSLGIHGSPGRGSGQQGPVLAAVVAQLQEEVSLAESRRHDAELAAQQAQQMAADLRHQLDKVQRQVAAKEELLAELAGRLEASTEAEGEIAAQEMAAAAEEARLERQRRQLSAADALIARLMDAVDTATGRRGALASTSSAGSPGSSPAGGNGSKARLLASRSTTSSISSASPHSSIGSAAVGR